MNTDYIPLTKALEVVDFENAKVHCNIKTYSLNSRLSSITCLDTMTLDNLCKIRHSMIPIS